MNVELTPNELDAIAQRVAVILEPRAEQASPWLDVKAASTYTGIPASTLYKDKTIPRHKPAGRLVFHRGELDDYMRGAP